MSHVVTKSQLNFLRSLGFSANGFKMLPVGANMVRRLSISLKLLTLLSPLQNSLLILNGFISLLQVLIM